MVDDNYEVQLQQTLRDDITTSDTHQHDNKTNEKPKIKHVKLQILLNNEFAPY
jgi:hypothetical protein